MLVHVICKNNQINANKAHEVAKSSRLHIDIGHTDSYDKQHNSKAYFPAINPPTITLKIIPT